MREGRKRIAALLLTVLFVSMACRQTGEQAGPTPIPPGDYDLTLEHDGLTRTYWLHVPLGYDGETEMPLVMVLHGGATSGKAAMAYSEMDRYANREGFLVVYPDGTGRLKERRILTWNAVHCCDYAFENQVDDLGFLTRLLEELKNNYAVDPDAVFVTGISNGAMMAYFLAAELSDQITAIAPVAGTIGGYASEGAPLTVIPDPAVPVSLIAFHGKQDPNVMYEGGHGEGTLGTRVDLSVAESIGFWVEADGCDPVPSQEVSESGNIIVDSYSGCEEGAQVKLVSIVDGNHSWPGSPISLPRNPATQEISASEMMVEFFLSFVE